MEGKATDFFHAKNQPDGSTEALVENGQAMDARDRSVKSNKGLKIILMVICGVLFFVMFASLSLTVITLNKKISELNTLALQQNFRLDIIHQQGSEMASVFGQVQTAATNNIDKEESMATKGLHLTGIRPFQSMTDHSGSGMETISNWYDKSAAGGNGKIQLNNNTKIMVEEDGFYMIYAQISWRMKQGMVMFEISKSSHEVTQTSAMSLANCIKNFDGEYAVMKTCYTSITVNLQKGDNIEIKMVKGNFSIDFDDEKSFFGISEL